MPGSSSLQQLLRDADRYPNLSAEEERAASPQQLVEHNIRLVVSIAQRMARNNPQYTLDDLASFGMPGLITASRKYDHRRGNRFSTHATWWIRQAIGRAIANDSGVPVYIYSNRELRREHVKERVYLSQAVSAHEDWKGEEALTWGQMLEDTAAAEESDGVVEDMGRKEQLDAILRLTKLSDRERLVIALRSGFYEERCWSLEEIGDYLGVTRERARQIEAHALTLLRLAASNLRRPMVESLSPTEKPVAAPTYASMESSDELSATNVHVQPELSSKTSSRRMKTVVRANKGSIARPDSASVARQKKRPPSLLPTERRAS